VEDIATAMPGHFGLEEFSRAPIHLFPAESVLMDDGNLPPGDENGEKEAFQTYRPTCCQSPVSQVSGQSVALLQTVGTRGYAFTPPRTCYGNSQKTRTRVTDA
jgi:hypothetical protein